MMNSFNQKCIQEYLISSINVSKASRSVSSEDTLQVSKKCIEIISTFNGVEFSEFARMLCSRDAISVTLDVKRFLKVTSLINSATSRERDQYLERCIRDQDGLYLFQSRYVIKEMIKDIEMDLASCSIGSKFYQSRNSDYPLAILRAIAETPVANKSAMIIALSSPNTVRFKANSQKVDQVLASFLSIKDKKDKIRALVINHASKPMLKHFFGGEIGDQSLTGMRMQYKVNMKNRSKSSISVRQRVDIISKYKEITRFLLKKKSKLTTSEMIEVYLQLHQAYPVGMDFLWSIVNQYLLDKNEFSNKNPSNHFPERLKVNSL